MIYKRYSCFFVYVVMTVVVVLGYIYGKLEGGISS